jgi:hypothetical protein
MILAITIVGTLFYFMKVKSYDTEDKTVEKIVSAEYQIKLPGQELNDLSETDEKGIADTGAEGKDGNTESQEGNQQSENLSANRNQFSSSSGDKSPATGSASNEESSSSSRTDKNTKTTKNNRTSSTNSKLPAKLTASAILNKYKPTFEDIEVQANDKVNELIGYAFEEYKDKKKNGKDISYFYFYSKYSAAGKVLESKTDESFNYAYNLLTQELKSKGFAESEASAFKEEYKQTKKERKSQLIAKAMDVLK